MTLRLESVTAAYGRTRVLHGVSLEVPSGAVTALLGRNGAGKTTTLRSVMGLVDREGSIRLDGTEIGDLRPSEVASAGVGWAPTKRHVFPDLTVEENLRMGFGRATPGADAIGRVYDRFPALEDRADRDAATLSGGERQMLVVGRALVRDPDALLLDEPTEGLMPAMVDAIGDAVRAAADRDCAVLLAEQNVERALAMSDSVVVLEDGEVADRLDAAAARDDPSRIERHLGP